MKIIKKIFYSFLIESTFQSKIVSFILSLVGLVITLLTTKETQQIVNNAVAAVLDGYVFLLLNKIKKSVTE